MFKNILIIVLLALTGMSLFVAIRNCKPICNDLIRWQDELICTYNLGDIPEDKADVIMVKDYSN